MINRPHLDTAWLASLPAKALHFVRGIEKEGLRVTPEAQVSQTDHPAGLGSALMHPHITTDYSEALLEFITPAMTEEADPLAFLLDVQQYAYSKMPEDELIWPGSMPAIIKDDLDVRIAEYGVSNIGKLKHVYRHGLWHRYGRSMQAIAGLHFNFSLPEVFWSHFQEQQKNSDPLQDFKSQGYFRLIRNFKRHSWLLMYLFGASPAMDASFRHKAQNMSKAGKHTDYLPYASSLRMSDIGYTNNKAQESLNVSINSLDAYIASMRTAIHTVHKPYQEIGLKNGDDYLQINSNILQIENEFYSDIRPKRTTLPGEKPVCALIRRGVEYVEIRCMDLDPFEPAGISTDTMHFLELFLVWCLLSENDAVGDVEAKELKENLRRVIHEGFDPDLMLLDNGNEVPIKSRIDYQLSCLKDLACVMDQVKGTSCYSEAVDVAQRRVENPETITSNRIRALMQSGQDHTEMMLELARQHKKSLSERPLSAELQSQLDNLSDRSIDQQQTIEQMTQLSFAQFIDAYQHQDDKYCQ